MRFSVPSPFLTGFATKPCGHGKRSHMGGHTTVPLQLLGPQRGLQMGGLFSKPSSPRLACPLQCLTSLRPHAHDGRLEKILSQHLGGDLIPISCESDSPLAQGRNWTYRRGSSTELVWYLLTFPRNNECQIFLLLIIGFKPRGS